MAPVKYLLVAIGVAFHAYLVHLYVARLAQYIISFVLNRSADPTFVMGIDLKYFPFVLSTLITMPTWLATVLYGIRGRRAFKA